MSLLTASSVFCYICRGILIQPVTLPCAHVFCYDCFEQSMQETSHSCPLCRKRISNWIRSVKKTNKLIDTKLWEKIKEQYKEQVRLKIAGEDDGLNEIVQNECDVHIPLSKTGEVAKEFSKLLQDFRSEQEKIQEAEELASRELIEKLKLEEETRIQQNKERNRRRLEEDEKLALIMQEELKTRRDFNSKQRLTESSCGKRTSKGPMDEFLKVSSTFKADNKQENYAIPVLEETDTEALNARDTSSESTDSFSMELNFFKPIKKVLRTPPKRYADGRVREINLTKVTPMKLSFVDSAQSSREIATVEGKRIHSMNSAFVDAINVCQTKSLEDEVESSPKRLKTSQDEPDMGILKDITMGENNDSNSTCTVLQNEGDKKKSGVVKHLQDNYKFPSMMKYHSGENEDGENDHFETQDYLSPSPTMEEKLIEEQRRIEQIIQQERKDRELAVRLSREWESETMSKPQTRSMLANSVKKKKNGFRNLRAQKTLVESGVISTSSKRK